MLKMIEIWSQTVCQLLQPLLEVSIFAVGEAKPLAVFQRLESDIAFLGKTGEISFEQLADGRRVKTLSCQFDDGDKSYIVQFRADISVFTQLQQQLAQIVQQPSLSESKGSWQQQISDGIHTYLHDQQCSVAALTRQQKRELVFKLKQQGLLDYKEATVYLANLLNLSRATIYNYLQSAKTITHLTIHQVNSFSDKPGGGNPAGVVLDAENIDLTSMQQLARELNYSETAFLIPSDKADFGLRYFTCEGIEVKFCGHSTVGTLYMLAKENYQPGEYSLKIVTGAGIIPAKIFKTKQNDITVQYEAPTIKLINETISHSQLSDNMGIALVNLDIQFPLMREQTNQTLFIKTQSLQALENIQCDFRKLKNYMKEHDLITCCVWINETFHSKNDIHMRCFCPSVGVNEDAFTGSVLGGLAAYLDRNHVLKADKHQFQVEQGQFVNRPGEVKVNFDRRGSRYNVTVTAKARHFFSTAVELVS